MVRLIAYLLFYLSVTSLGLSLTLQDAYSKVEGASHMPSEAANQFFNSPVYLSTLKSLSPGYSFEDDKAFVRSKFPFPSKLKNLRRYKGELENFSKLEKLREQFYIKVQINELFYSILLYNHLLDDSVSLKEPIQYNQLLFEKKSSVARLKKILTIPYHEPLTIEAAIEQINPKKIEYSVEHLEKTFDSDVDIQYARKSLDLEKLKLKTQQRSYLPNFLLTIEYYNQEDNLSTIVGLDFPLLDARHRALAKDTKRTITTKQEKIIKIDNDSRIELYLLVDEANHIVDQLALYSKMTTDKQALHKTDVLKLKARYATIISHLDLIKGY